jgi:spore cortex biosynthesis protein YabQ
MSRQAVLFLSTVGAGAAIGFFYDIFRIFRKTASHKNIAVQLEDLFFWLAATVLVFYFMLNQNYGEIRFFVIIGVVCGLALYVATISRWVVAAAVAIINFLKKVIAAALRIIFLPISLLIKFLTPPVKKLLLKIRKHLHAAKVYGKIKIRRTAKHWHIIRRKV